MPEYSKYQYAIFRILLSISLFACFSGLLYSLFYNTPFESSAGAPQTRLQAVFAGHFFLEKSLTITCIFLTLLIVASAGLAIGLYRRALSFLLLTGWLLSFSPAAIALNPGILLLAWLLFICAITPHENIWTIRDEVGKTGDWQLSKTAWWGTWVVALIVYSMSATCILIMDTNSLEEINLGLTLLGVGTTHIFLIHPKWFITRTKERHIVYFDGHCGLCNKAVNFLIAIDPDKILRFSPLQGFSAAQRLPLELRKNLSSLVYFKANEIYTQSSAIIKILKDLGGLWYLLSRVMILFPRLLRDIVYRIISKYRRKFFQQELSCRTTHPDERELFLD